MLPLWLPSWIPYINAYFRNSREKLNLKLEDLASTKIDGFIRKGYLSEKDRPLWFDVYVRFPPKYEPSVTREVPDVEVKEIFYEEDRLRAKIHKQFQLKHFDLESKHESHSQRLIKACQEYISKGMSEDDAISELKNSQQLQFRD